MLQHLQYYLIYPLVMCYVYWELTPYLALQEHHRDFPKIIQKNTCHYYPMCHMPMHLIVPLCYGHPEVHVTHNSGVYMNKMPFYFDATILDRTSLLCKKIRSDFGTIFWLTNIFIMIQKAYFGSMRGWIIESQRDIIDNFSQVDNILIKAYNKKKEMLFVTVDEICRVLKGNMRAVGTIFPKNTQDIRLEWDYEVGNSEV